MHGRGHAWQWGVCMAKGCMAGERAWWGAWQGGMHGRGRGACMAGGMCGRDRGHAWQGQGGMHGGGGMRARVDTMGYGQ